MANYDAGMLHQFIEIKRKVETPDGMGGSVTTLSTVECVWAFVRPMSGRERAAFAGIEVSSNYLIVVRAGADVTENDVIEWEGRQLNVRFVKPYPLSPWLEIEAEMGVAL